MAERGVERRWVSVMAAYIELAIVVLLLVVAVLTIVLIIVQIGVTLTRIPLAELTSERILIILGDVLTGFVAIELVKIGIAYMRHENVVPTVLEAALVAVARKVVIFEPTSVSLWTGIVLAALMLSVAGTSLLLARALGQDAVHPEEI